jgi:hypothetical protein
MFKFIKSWIRKEKETGKKEVDSNNFKKMPPSSLREESLTKTTTIKDKEENNGVREDESK